MLDKLLHLSGNFLVLLHCCLVLVVRWLPPLVNKVIKEPVSDVNSLEDSLKVSDVIKQAAVEHLYKELNETEHLLLSVRNLQFLRYFM